MAKKGKKTKKAEAEPMKLFYIFYNQERWDNWINTLSEADFSGGEDEEDMPEGYQILYSFNQDICVSVLKIIKLYQNERFNLETALEKIDDVEKIIMGPQPEGELAEIIDSLQLSMLVLFGAVKTYLSGDYEEEIKTLVKKGRETVEQDVESALDIASNIGAAVINGKSCCGRYLRSSDEPSLFDEWLIEIETMSEALSTLKNFDEEAGEGA